MIERKAKTWHKVVGGVVFVLVAVALITCISHVKYLELTKDMREPDLSYAQLPEAHIDSVVKVGNEVRMYASNTVNNIQLFHMANALRSGGIQEPVAMRLIYSVSDDTTDLVFTAEEIDTIGGDHWIRFTSTDSTYEADDTIITAHLLDSYDSLLTEWTGKTAVDSGSYATLRWKLTLS